MPVRTPIKELKNAAGFTKLAGNSNSSDAAAEAFAALSTSTHGSSRTDAARARLYQSIYQAESDIAAGRTFEARAAINDIRSRYGI